LRSYIKLIHGGSQLLQTYSVVACWKDSNHLEDLLLWPWRREQSVLQKNGTPFYFFWHSKTL